MRGSINCGLRLFTIRWLTAFVVVLLRRSSIHSRLLVKPYVLLGNPSRTFLPPLSFTASAATLPVGSRNLYSRMLSCRAVYALPTLAAAPVSTLPTLPAAPVSTLPTLPTAPVSTIPTPPAAPVYPSPPSDYALEGKDLTMTIEYDTSGEPPTIITSSMDGKSEQRNS